MKISQILDVTARYRAVLAKRCIQTRVHPHDKLPVLPDGGLEHCSYMLDQIDVFAQARRFGKCYRWLGFVQGVLWANGVYTIDEMKEQNRSDILG